MRGPTRTPNPTCVALALVLVLALAAPAAAQDCGDADANGAVSLSDGVATLRAAASLSTSCVPAVCDMDGTGTITLSDGVAVLRKAAALAVDNRCLNVEADELVDQVQPAIEIGIGLLGGIGGGAGARAAQANACANDGTLELDPDGTGGGTARFTDCEIDGFVFDGTLVFGRTSVGYDITVTEVATGIAATFTGTLSASFFDDGSFSVSGSLRFASSVLGDFTIRFVRVIAAPEGEGVVIRAGTVAIDSDFAGGLIDTVVLTFGTGPVIDVTARLVDGTDVDYDYDLRTGELKLAPATAAPTP